MKKICLLALLLGACPTPEISGKTHLNSRRGTRTVKSVMDEISPFIVPILKKKFASVGSDYPPKNLMIFAFKEERRLEVWTKVLGAPKLVLTYPIRAASGSQGPKLMQGDYQVPEGIYKLHALNPNSSYHLSLRVNYPNSLDRAQAKKDGRTDLGGDIFVHGNSVSAGCLAMGDHAIEQLFTLAASVRPLRIPIIISPHDFREIPRPFSNSGWLTSLYSAIEEELNKYSE